MTARDRVRAFLDARDQMGDNVEKANVLTVWVRDEEYKLTTADLREIIDEPRVETNRYLMESVRPGVVRVLCAGCQSGVEVPEPATLSDLASYALGHEGVRHTTEVRP